MKRIENSDVLNQSLLQLRRLARLHLCFKNSMFIFLWLLFSWTIGFTADRLGETPLWFRSINLATGCILATWTMICIIRGFVCQTRSLRWLASQVRKKFGAKGERLLGIVEISVRPANTPITYSESIFEAAMKKVEEEIRLLPLERTFQSKKEKPVLIAIFLLTLVPLSCLILHPHLALNTTQRWAMPWSKVERVSLTNLWPSPNIRYVAKNEPINMRFTLSPESMWIPEKLNLQFENRTFVAFHNHSIYEFEVPGLSFESDFLLKAGDYRKVFSVIPLERPRLKAIEAEIKFPSYLEYPNRRIDAFSSTFSFPKSSEIEFFVRTNRTLSSVFVSGNENDPIVEIKPMGFAFDLPSQNFSESFRICFLDKYGIAPARPFSLKTKAVEDMPPVVAFAERLDLAPILISETRKISFQAKDDFGLSKVGLSLTAKRGSKTLFSTKVIESKLTSPNERAKGIHFPFDPNFFNLEDGDEVEFTAMALDRYPERKILLSSPLSFLIVGKEKHAQFIKNRMEVIFDEISEIARIQEDLILQNLFLQEQITTIDSFEENELTKKFSSLSIEEKKIADELHLVAGKTAEILREASRNDLLETLELGKLGNMVSEMNHIASQKMEPVAVKLSKVQPSASSIVELTETIEWQEDALTGLKSILSKASKQADRMESMTLSHRLRKIEAAEKTIAFDLQNALSETIGYQSSSLSMEMNKLNQEMKAMQTETTKEAYQIQREISRYNERTGKAQYGRVAFLMNEAKTEEGLGEISRKIGENLFLRALDELDLWETKFGEWADLLEKELLNSNAGSSSGFKNEQLEDMTSQIIELFSIRKKQKNLLSKTRIASLENFLVQRVHWKKMLSKRQDELMLDLTDLQIEFAKDFLNDSFDDVHTLMHESLSGMERGDFHENTLDAQEEAINVLSDMINLLLESSSSSKGTESNGQENTSLMEFLIHGIKGENTGRQGADARAGSGGGSNQGGNLRKVMEQTNSTKYDLEKEQRKTQNSSGNSQNPPPEFREAMDRYFRDLERNLP